MPDPFVEARINKADQFLRGATSATDRGDWDVAVSDAILAGIAACDAYLALRHAVRSSGPHHRLASLLRKHGGPGVAKQVEALGRMIAFKTDSQYGQKMFGAREARETIARAERLVAWARDAMKGAQT